MKARKITLTFLIIFAASILKAQEKPFYISQVLSEGSLTSPQSQRLVLIDFWATWCGPCIVVNKQLEILQNRQMDKIFIVSLSNESIETIKRHLARRPSQLYVVADHENKTVDQYQVPSWPYSVLLNSSGEVIWQGHPADLSESKLEEYYRKEKPNANKIAKLVQNCIVENHKNKIETYDLTYIDQDEIYFEHKLDYIYYTGNLRDLTRRAFHISDQEIDLGQDANTSFTITAKSDYWKLNIWHIWKKVMDDQKMSIEIQDKYEQGIQLVPQNKSGGAPINTFMWSGDDITPNYLISGETLKADNYSVKELSSLLSQIHKTTIFIPTTLKTKLRFDWEINISNLDATLADLWDKYFIGNQRPEQIFFQTFVLK